MAWDLSDKNYYVSTSASSADDAQQPRRGRRLVSFFIGLVLFSVGIVGGYLVFDGLTPQYRQQEVPLPQNQFAASPNDIPVIEPTDGVIPNPPHSENAPTPVAVDSLVPPGTPPPPVSEVDKQYKVHDADTDGGPAGWSNWDVTTPVTSMSVSMMKPNSAFIPSLGVYIETRMSDKFESSNYKNFQTLDIPRNPHRGVSFASGAPLVGGDEGTTFVAGHVSHGTNIRGALYDLHKAKLGQVVWTKDAQGHIQKWKVIKVWHKFHKEFPQQYFSNSGPRQLVLITCGGYLNPQGYFNENVFVVATPIPLV